MCFSVAMIMLLMLFSTLCPIETSLLLSSFFHSFIHAYNAFWLLSHILSYLPPTLFTSPLLPTCPSPRFMSVVVLWPIDFNQGHVGDHYARTVHWSLHKWVCRGRQWLLVSPDLSVANSWAVRTEAPEALLHPCLVVTVPFSCLFSVDISSYSELVIVAVASLTEDCTSQPLPIVQPSRSFLSLAHAAPRALGAAVSLFQAEPCSLSC